MGLTFRHFGTHITLSVGERSISFTDPTPTYRRIPMRLARRGDSVTLYRGGIPLLSLSSLPAAQSVQAPLRIVWKDYHAMIHYFYDLCVATAE